ncbi:MAG: CerR family C-terminal domain-containing protein [Sphingomonadales bacterium]|nr:CerR family C-terminal domain-containing protein [Sphingomonadales bacterium]MDE2568819.1 CerR family C-terminal domain-containing protein [Sphingomonadales bacterium]
MEAQTIMRQAPGGTTAERILASGMACFAREGFAGATTRMIAAEAGVTLPVIAYHFGNKDGLHRACAQEIVEQHRRGLLPLTSAAREAASGPLAPEAAREWLEKILSALVAMITADTGQRLSTDFVLREMSEQGPGYALLFEELWQPGIGLVADLVAIARKREPGNEDDRAGALMLIASLSAFTREEPISRAFLGWDALDDDRRGKVAGIAHRLLAGLVAE